MCWEQNPRSCERSSCGASSEDVNVLHSNEACVRSLRSTGPGSGPRGPWEGPMASAARASRESWPTSRSQFRVRDGKTGNREQDSVDGERRRGWEEGLVESV